MLTFENAVHLLLSNTAEALEKLGFSVVVPKGSAKEDLPVSTVEDHQYLDFAAENKGRFRLDFFGNQAILFVSDTEAEDDFKRVSTNFFDLDSFDEKDIKSFSNELTETLEVKFGANAVKNSKKVKTPVPVSRSAVRNGSQSYDANTLANRLLALYPQLKEPYRANFEKYSDFMAEEFFDNYATPLIIGTIKSRSQKDCTKLFRILNDIYESGLNDTQSLIAVTILGKMENDPQMLETASEYMCDDMREPVIFVNKYLYSRSGKKDLEKLKNPPPFKPKKKKEPGMFAQAMSGGMTPPPIN